MDTMDREPLAQLSKKQIEELGHEFDAIAGRGSSPSSAGPRPPLHHIENRSNAPRLGGDEDGSCCCSRRWEEASGAEVAQDGRRFSLARMLEGMEIGRNVMRGQWDSMNDPDVRSGPGSGTP